MSGCGNVGFRRDEGIVNNSSRDFLPDKPESESKADNGGGYSFYFVDAALLILRIRDDLKNSVAVVDEASGQVGYAVEDF